MKNLFKISLLMLAFGFANNSFSQEIKKTQDPVKKNTYDSKKNKPLKKEKVTPLQTKKNVANPAVKETKKEIKVDK